MKCYDNDGCKHLLDSDQVRPPFDVRTTEKYICELANCPLDVYKQARLDGMKEALEIVNVVIGSPKLAQKLTRAIESAMEVNND